MIRNILAGRNCRVLAVSQLVISRSINYSSSQPFQDEDLITIQPSDLFRDPDKKKKEYVRNDKQLASFLKDVYKFTEADARNLIRTNKKHWSETTYMVSRNIEVLRKNNITAETLLADPRMLGVPNHTLQTKLDTIIELKPRNINDFAPLISLPLARLARFVENMSDREKHDCTGNRIYYFSFLLKVEPIQVAKHFADPESHFMLELPIESIKSILTMMTSFDISRQSILNELRIFKMNPNAIRARLEYFRQAGEKNIDLSLLHQKGLRLKMKKSVEDEILQPGTS